jgi:hypothetical protein
VLHTFSTQRRDSLVIMQANPEASPSRIANHSSRFPASAGSLAESGRSQPPINKPSGLTRDVPGFLAFAPAEWVNLLMMVRLIPLAFGNDGADQPRVGQYLGRQMMRLEGDGTTFAKISGVNVRNGSGKGL